MEAQMLDDYKVVVGLEVHAELLTNSKVFCSCKAQFADEPNINICPVCTGQPGALPIINRAAIENAIKAGLAFNCAINQHTHFDRKNYFYPDNPKSYQISQSTMPLCINGSLELSTGTNVRINRIHVEEDAGKMIHDAYTGKSLIDFNRAGVGLIEIVTEPDMKSGKEVVEFIEKVRQALQYLGVCDAKMEEGSLRADVNISVSKNPDVLGERAEIKNMNSLHAIERAISFEAKRQSEILDAGGEIFKETRKFNELTNETESMRRKENANDYRYFPEPDVLHISISDADIDKIRLTMPLMPKARIEIYTGKYGLSEADAKVIAGQKYVSDFYDESVKIYDNYKSLAKFLLTEILRRIKDLQNLTIPFSPQDFAETVKMADSGTVNRNDAKEIIRVMFENGGKPVEIAKNMGLVIETDENLVKATICKILDENSQLLASYFAGKQNLFGFFMGEAMKQLKGKALAKDIKSALESEIAARK
jgi:aspartyl-tRNA(Asn)/glutamyl-tRNA(Gln) amidotransferase subunit B